MFKILRDFLLYHAWSDNTKSILAMLKQHFHTFTPEQQVILLRLVAVNREVLFAFLNAMSQAQRDASIQLLFQPYRPTRYIGNNCPITLTPIIRATGMLYCAIGESGDTSYHYLANDGVDFEKVRECPLTRGKILWLVRLCEMDDDLFTQFVTTNERQEQCLKTGAQLADYIKLISAAPENTFVSLQTVIDQCPRYVNLGLSAEAYDTLIINTLFAVQDDRGWSFLSANSKALMPHRTILAEIFQRLNPWELVKALIKYPDLLEQITSDTWNRAVTAGPAAGTTPIYWLCSSREERALLSQHPKVVEQITPDTWNRAVTAGPHAGTTPLYWLCGSPERLALLSQNPKVVEQIRPDTWNLAVTAGPDAGRTPIFGLCSGPEGRALLSQHPKVVEQITPDTWNRAVTAGPAASTTPIYWLCASPEGHALLSQHPKVVEQITPATWNQVVSKSGETALDQLRKTAEGLSLLQKFLPGSVTAIEVSTMSDTPNEQGKRERLDFISAEDESRVGPRKQLKQAADGQLPSVSPAGPLHFFPPATAQTPAEAANEEVNTELTH